MRGRPDGKVLASAGRDSAISLFEVDSGKELFPSDECTDYVNLLAISPDGKTLAFGSTSSRDRVIYVADVAARAIKLRLRPAISIRDLAFSPDGRTLATSGGPIQLWNVATGAPICKIEGPAVSLAFSRDGKTLAVAPERFDRTSPAIRLVDAASGQYLPKSLRCSEDLSHIAISPDGTALAAKGGPGPSTVHIFDLGTGEEKRTLSLRDGFESLDFSPDGRALVIGEIGVAEVFDPMSGQMVRLLEGFNGEGPGRSVQFVDAKTILAWRERTAVIYDLDADRVVRKLEGAGRVRAVSANGKIIISGQADGTVLIFEAPFGP